MNKTIRKSMLFNSSVYTSRHPVRLADKNCDVSVITLYRLKWAMSGLFTISSMGHRFLQREMSQSGKFSNL